MPGSGSMSLAETLIATELSSRKGEQDVFRRLQERIGEVEELKRERAAMVAEHQRELANLNSQMSGYLEELERERIEQIELKDCSIAELRDVIHHLTSDPGMVVDQLRRAYVCGVRSPSKLRPPRLTEPVFRAPTKMPTLIPQACLSSFDYEKLHKVIKGATSKLPGDQVVLRCIQNMAQAVLTALKDTDSPETQDECIARVRTLLRFVLDAREKCAWGDYVRPSHQHVEGPDISPFTNIVDIDQGLTSAERQELEALAREQDLLEDPMALKSLMEQLAEDCAARLREFDVKKQEVQAVHVAAFRRFQEQANAVMTAVRDRKNAACRDYERAITEKETRLVEQKGELADVLSRIQRTLQDINELQVCQAEVEESLTVDEKNCAKVNIEVEEKVAQLEVYEYTLEKRKRAIASVGIMEQEVITHINDLLLERGKDIFDGRHSSVMRQFEVLPNVYCQCAIFEDL